MRKLFTLEFGFFTVGLSHGDLVKDAAGPCHYLP
jgi:hypothetical protein